MSQTVEPFSNGVQIGLRVPVILIALAGVVLALVLIRRLGTLAGVLGALGSLLVAVDQVVNIAWVLHLTSMADEDFDANAYSTANNAYTLADAVLITLGVALLVAAIVAAAVKRPAAAGAQASFPAQSPYQQQQQLPQSAPPFPQSAPPFPQSAPPSWTQAPGQQAQGQQAQGQQAPGQLPGQQPPPPPNR